MPIYAYRGNNGPRYIDDAGREYSAEELKAQSRDAGDDRSFLKTAADAVSNFAMELPDKIELAMKHNAYAQLDANYHYYKDSDADRNADLQAAAQSLGIAVDTIENADTTTQDDAIKYSKDRVLTGDDIANFPVLSNMLRDPTIMSQSFDDIQALADIERGGGILSDAYNLAEATQELNDIDYKALQNQQKLDELDYDTMLRRKQLLARIALLQDRNKEDPYFTFSLSNMAIDTAFDAVKSVTNVADSGEALLGSMAAGLIAGTAIPGAGNIAGAAAGAASYFAMTTAMRAGVGAAAEQYRNLSINHSVEDAATGAKVTGIATGLLNLPFFGGVLSNYVLKTGAKTGLLKRMGINVAENFGLGAAMGASQVAGTKVADGKASFNMNDARTIADGGMSLAALGGIMSLPGYGWAGVHALGEKVAKSKLAKRNPETVKQLIDSTLADDSGKPFTVSINAQRFYDYLASIEPQEAQKIYNAFDLTPERLKFLIDSDGDVTASLGQVLTKVDEIHRDALSEDIKTNNQMSFRELADLAKNGEEYGNAKAEDLAKREEDGDTIAELAEIKKELETEIDQDVEAEVDADPLYLASDILEGKIDAERQGEFVDNLKLDLQLFGYKEAKETAKDYIDGNLSPDAIAAMDVVAKEYGFSSAAELADAIIKNDTKTQVKTKRKQKRLEKALAEIGVTDKQSTLEFTEERLKVNDENTGKVATEAAKIEDAIANSGRDAKLDELGKSDIYEQPNLWDMLDEMAKQCEATAEGDTKSEKLTRLEQLRNRIKELKAQQKEILRETKAELKEQAREKISDLKDAQREKISFIKEEQAKKIADLKSNYETIIQDLRREIKDSDEKRAARRGEIGKKQAKEEARATLAVMPICDVLDWKTFLKRAEEMRMKAEAAYAKAINKTPDAFADEMTMATKIDLLRDAAAYKNKELKLRAMARESLRCRSAVSKLEREFKRDVKAIKNDQRNANKGKYTVTKADEHYNAVGELLEKFGILQPEEWNRQPSRDANFTVYVNRMNQNLGIMRIPDWIMQAMENSEQIDWQGLNLEQAADISDALRNVKQAANLENKMLTSEKQESISKVRNAMLEEMGSVQKKDWKNEDKKLLAKFRNAWKDQYTFDTIISNLFGDNSVMHDVFIKRKWMLDNKERAWVQKYDSMYRAIWNEYSTKEQKYINQHKLYIEELGISLTKRQLMTIALNMGNAGNRSKLFPTDKNKRPIDVQDAPADRWNEQNVLNALSNNLDAKDWKTIQATWDLLNAMTPDLVAHEKARTGFTPKMVEGQAFTIKTKDGQEINLTGGYYPLSQDIRSATMQAKNAEADTLADMLEHPTGISSTNHGFMKQRTNAEYEVSLDPSLLARHITNVAHDLYFRDYVSDIYRLRNNDTFQLAVKEAFGAHGEKTMDSYIKQVIGDSYREAGYEAAYAIGSYLRRSMVAGSIVLNFPVIVQNIANLPLYVGAVDGFGTKEMFHAIAKYGLPFWSRGLFQWKDHEKFIQENLSPYMLELFKQPDASFRHLDRQADLVDKAGGTVSEVAGNIADFSAHLMWMTDAFASVPMWMEMYNKTLAETGDKVAAMEKADMLIRRVNGSPNKADQSLFIRADRNLYSFMNLFMGFFNAEFNRWARETSQFIDKPIQGTPRMLAFAASRVILFNLASELLMGAGPEDDEGWGQWTLRKGIEYPATLTIFTKDFIPPAVNAYFGTESMPYRGSSIWQPLSALHRATTSTAKAFREPEKERIERALQDTTQSMTYFAHMPKWMWSIFWNAYDWSVNDMSFQMGDIFKRRPSKERGE